MVAVFVTRVGLAMSLQRIDRSYQERSNLYGLSPVFDRTRFAFVSNDWRLLASLHPSVRYGFWPILLRIPNPIYNPSHALTSRRRSTP